MSKTEEIIAKIQAIGSNHYGQFPIVMEKGEGMWMTDVEGKDYLDCVACYSALPFGHCPEFLANAAADQVKQLHLCGGFVHHTGVEPVLRRLTKLTGLARALMMNSGAEAVEAAVKVARKWAYTRKNVPSDQAEIIVCTGNFHGRTTGIVSFSSTEQYKELFGPSTPGYVTIPFGDAKALEAAITPNTAAFLVEPGQGEGGIIMPPEGYLKAIRDICDKHNVLLIFDEIQTGLGRTGIMFAHQHEAGVMPDLMTLGKALSGGVSPVSAVVGTEAVISVFEPGDHGSTFATNPLACRMASESLDYLVEQNLVERSRDMGAVLKAKLSAIDSSLISEVRGKGLFIGVALSDSAPEPKELCMRLIEEGLFINETKGALRVTPPLIITEKEIDIIVETITRVFSEYEQNHKKKVAAG